VTGWGFGFCCTEPIHPPGRKQKGVFSCASTLIEISRGELVLSFLMRNPSRTRLWHSGPWVRLLFTLASGPAMPRIETALDFERSLNAVSGDVTNAMKLFHTFIEFDRYAAEKPEVLSAVNRDASFWKTAIHGMQAGVFVTLYRVFDDSGDAHSIVPILAAGVRHPEFFSRETLEVRKKRLAEDGNPPWLLDYLDNAWYPAADDMKGLARIIGPHKDQFIKIYEPIRSRVFAHRLEATTEAIQALFERTNITELEGMLRALFHTVQNLDGLIMNGRKFRDTSAEYDSDVAEIREDTRSVLDKVTGGAGTPSS
jgi:hypothetical protein